MNDENKIEETQQKIEEAEQKIEWRNRLRSWALWLAIAALIVFLVKEFTGIDISETVNTIMNLLLPILIAFGIINNPNNPKRI